MRTLLLSAFILITLATQAQKAPWQSNKHFYPFIEFAVNPRIGNDNTWTGFDAGILNKNTLFKIGATSGHWDKDNIVLIAAIQRRTFTIGRFEQWMNLGSAQTLTHRLPFNLGYQALIKYQLDKSVFFYGGTGGQFFSKNNGFKWQGLQYTTGIAITFRGNVNRPY